MTAVAIPLQKFRFRVGSLTQWGHKWSFVWLAAADVVFVTRFSIKEIVAYQELFCVIMILESLINHDDEHENKKWKNKNK